MGPSGRVHLSRTRLGQRPPWGWYGSSDHGRPRDGKGQVPRGVLVEGDPELDVGTTTEVDGTQDGKRAGSPGVGVCTLR